MAFEPTEVQKELANTGVIFLHAGRVNPYEPVLDDDAAAVNRVLEGKDVEKGFGVGKNALMEAEKTAIGIGLGAAHAVFSKFNPKDLANDFATEEGSKEADAQIKKALRSTKGSKIAKELSPEMKKKLDFLIDALLEKNFDTKKAEEEADRQRAKALRDLNWFLLYLFNKDKYDANAKALAQKAVPQGSGTPVAAGERMPVASLIKMNTPKSHAWKVSYGEHSFILGTRSEKARNYHYLTRKAKKQDNLLLRNTGLQWQELLTHTFIIRGMKSRMYLVTSTRWVPRGHNDPFNHSKPERTLFPKHSRAYIFRDKALAFAILNREYEQHKAKELSK